jgi:hypothetical protein
MAYGGLCCDYLISTDSYVHLVMEEFDFVLVLILTLVLTGRGRRIRLASKIPFYLLSYLSICHLQNYGVKARKFYGREKDPLPVSSTKKILQATVRLSTVQYHVWKQKHVSVFISTTDGNRNMFPFPTNESSNHGLYINPNTLL